MTVKNPVESILALAASVFDAYSVVLFEAPKAGQKAQILAAYSQGEHIDQYATITPGRGLVGWILRNHSPIVIGSIDENHAYLGYYKEDQSQGICSFLGCPLPDGGILCVDSRQRHAFSPEKQKLIAVFADMLAQVQHMEAEVVSDPSGDYLTALNRMADLRRSYGGWKSYLTQLLPIVLENSGFHYAAFASRAEGSSSYIVEGEYPPLLLKESEPVEIAVHNGIVGWVFRNEEAVFNDGQSGIMPLFGKRNDVPDFAAAVCVPVQMNKSTCGVLCIASRDKQPIEDPLRIFMRLAADDLGRMLEVVALRYRLRMAEKRSQGER